MSSAGKATDNARRRGSGPRRTAHVIGGRDGPISAAEERELRQRVLQDTATVTRSIAEAVVLKEGDLFLLTEPGGFVPLTESHGLGLYYHDCRYLNGYELTIAEGRPDVLVSTTAQGYTAVSQLTTPDILLADGRLLSKEDLGIRRERIIANDRLALHDLITFSNYGLEPIAFPLALTFRAGFEDVFAVRGMRSANRGTVSGPSWAEGALQFAYDGADGLQRRLVIHFSPAPHRTDGATAHFRVRLRPRQEFFAAGVPWFATLFGRDSLITALQTLAYNPRIAEQTLRILARYQGEREDPWRDEEPGKILHELRLGEMARTGEVPHTPYFGTIDATPLFLVLLGRHAAWTGELRLFHDLRENIERALAWMTCYGDLDGDGYLEYVRKSEGGLDNQGWRDSGDGVPNRDGSLATPPIALCEVQGYAYWAKVGIADLYRRAGEPERADQLDREAAELRARFNRDFWLEDEGFYALALQAAKRPAAVLTSNPGHVLWTGIADPDEAARTVERLLADDMFSGWGIRTLSAREARYNPTGYHLGTIWPHDNSIAAAGFRRYGFAGAVARVFEGIVEAALRFPDYRLPELFMGFPRDDYGVPVSYPVACRPQAWAAGAVPHLVRSLLGLEPEGFEQRLRIVRPVLPEFLQSVEVRRLRVGAGSVDLRFERTPSGNVAVDVLNLDGPLDVVQELGPA